MQRKVEIGFGFALACLALVGVVSYFAVVRFREDATRITHTRDVINRLESIFSENIDAQNGARGFAVTGDESYLEPYERAAGSMPSELRRLQALTAETPGQRGRLEQLSRLVAEQIEDGREVIEARRNEGFEGARRLLLTRRGKQIHDRVRVVLGEIKAAEEALLMEREARAARSASLTQTVIVAGGVLGFGFVGLALLAIRRDFAGRSQAERALRQSEESLAVTLHSIGDAVLATDRDGKITRMNRVAEHLTGWTLAEAAGRPIEDVFHIIHEETRAPAEIPVNRVLATGEVQGLVNHTVLVARDGTERAIADSAAPIRDRHGRVRGVVLVFRDVSAERAAEIKLAEALTALARERERLKFIFDAVPVGISFVVTDPAGRQTRMINDAHLRICGITAEEAQDQETFVQITHPDDREAQAVLVERLKAGEIDHASIDKRYVLPDGRITWVMLSFQRRKPGEGGYEDLSIVVDITARKEAIAQLERFFELSLDFLCISSADGYFKRVSPAVTDILGWEVEEFLARPYLELVHPDDQAATVREVQRQVLAGEKVFQFENRYRHKNGSWRVLSWRSVPQPDGLMYATARDVTERHRIHLEIQRLNAELRHHAARLESANRELEAFSYSVSHDLRAPLRHIQGYVGMLGREIDERLLTEKARRYMKTISDAGHTMGVLIDDLLAFSRMGRAEMRETKIDPRELIEEVRRELEVVTSGRNIRWKIQALPPLAGDPAMLKQVFANLLGNAVKYSRGRDPAEIEIGSAGQEDGKLVIFVRDNGAGFDMKYAGKLFGVFQRLHRAEEFEGTGIGLANVRRIVGRHGGRTWAEGALNEGATFYFTIRIAEGDGAHGDGV